MSVKLNKSDVYERLKFESIEQMNLTLLALADCLTEEGKEVPDEIANPDNYGSITKEHLTLLRDYLNKAQGPALPSENLNGNSAIASTNSQEISQSSVPESAPGTIAGFRETLKQLGVQYVAKAAGYDISDNFFLALDKALTERNEQNLAERIDIYKGEFDSAVDSIKQTAKERANWQEQTLGKFTALANFTDLDEKLAGIQKN